MEKNIGIAVDVSKMAHNVLNGLSRFLLADRGSWRYLPKAEGIDLVNHHISSRDYENWRKDPVAQARIGEFIARREALTNDFTENS